MDDSLSASEKLSKGQNQQVWSASSENVADTSEVLDWNDPNDPENPRNFSKARKWAVASAAIFATLIIPLNGTSITVATARIDATFNISNHPFPNSYWPVASWTLGGALLVVVGMPLIEDFGVRRSFFVLYVFFILMVIPQALAGNFATLVITRFFGGACVSLLANIASSSVIPDVWATEKERSLPLSIWILSYLLGYTLGPPIFAGIIEYNGDWRWIFYAQLIIYTAFLPIFWFFIQETRCTVILRRRNKALRKLNPQAGKTDEIGLDSLKQLASAAARPVYLLCTEPLLLACTIWEGFCFGTVFMFTQSVQQVFGEYGWESWDIGYVQSAVAVGETLGWIVSLYGTHVYLKSASWNTECPGHPVPEARLYSSVFGSFIGIVGGMFVYAWTTQVHWILPAIGLAMVGFGIQIVVSGVADYIEDAYAASDYAGSAISACAAGENVFAGLLPLATSQMYNTLGNEWASSLLGFIALLLSFAPLALIWKGKWLRERSPFMASNGQICNEK